MKSDPPTECAACPPKDLHSFPLKRDGVIEQFCEPHHASLAEKDARIRELEAQVSDGLDSWPSFGITNGQRQWRLQAKAALARSEGGT